MNEAIQRAIEKLGSGSSLATAIGRSPQFVSQLFKGDRPVPVELCVSIERATDGAVTRRDLRPDDWHLIWPELIGAEGAPSTTADAVKEA